MEMLGKNARRAAVLVDHSTVGVTASAAPEPAFLRGAIVAGSPVGWP
jgi:hypothetical protein